MSIWKYMRRQFLFIVLIFSLLVSCSPYSEQRPVRQPLKVEWTQWWGDYTLIVAKELGLFDKYNVDVEPVYYELFSNAIPDLVSSQIDAGLFGLGDAMALAGSKDIKVVVVYDNGGVSAIVAAPDIDQPSELKGKSIGANVGTYHELFVDLVLEEGGLDPGDITLVNTDPEMVPSLIPDVIQAGYTWEPHISEARSKGFNVIYENESGPDMTIVPDVIVFRAEVVNNRPDDVRSFVKAWFEAVEFRRDNPEKANEIIGRVIGYDVELSPGDPYIYGLEENLKAYSRVTNRDTKTIYEIAQINLDFLIRLGRISIAPDIYTVFDPSFLE